VNLLYRLVFALGTLGLCSCSGQKPDSSWLKGWHDNSVVFALQVFGKEGNPYVAILTRVRAGSTVQTVFRWQHTTGDKSSDVLIDGKPLPYSGKLIVVVNDSNGSAKIINLPSERTKEFSQGEMEHWDKACFQKFWDDVVQPQLESK
jgi:hypothetical protein